MASWNIREFDSGKYGSRLRESYYYLAEVISSFDLVAIQEVNRDLKALDKLMEILGGHWKYIFSDVTGNSERMVFVYNSHRIEFGGLSGEMVIPPKVGVASKQIQRTPMICGFKSEWAKFMICSIHAYYGKDKAEDKGRIAELERIAKFLKKRMEDKKAWTSKLILVGDFNIYSKKDKTYKIFTDAGFVCPTSLDVQDFYTNTAAKKRQFDQILVLEREDHLQFLRGGTFNFFEHVFTKDDKEMYATLMKKDKDNPEDEDEYYPEKQYSQWRTHQMSDHQPLWVELRIDYGDEYLQNKLDQAK